MCGFSGCSDVSQKMQIVSCNINKASSECLKFSANIWTKKMALWHMFTELSCSKKTIKHESNGVWLWNKELTLQLFSEHNIFTFTFIYLADAFVQNDIRVRQIIHHTAFSCQGVRFGTSAARLSFHWLTQRKFKVAVGKRASRTLLKNLCLI